MTEETIKKYLEERRIKVDLYAEAEENARMECEAVITPEMRLVLDEVNYKQKQILDKYADIKNNLRNAIELAEMEIRTDALALGKTVKCDAGQVVYYHGRVTWDSKKLDGMMILLPQLGEARKVGEPYAVIK